jgi:hypothetical protein
MSYDNTTSTPLYELPKNISHLQNYFNITESYIIHDPKSPTIRASYKQF